MNERSAADNSFAAMTCEEFLSRLASKAPVPGGGGASALVGAIGCALGNMVGSLTAGKKKYAAVEEDILRLNGEAEKLIAELTGLIEKDAAAFAPLAKAYGLPKDTEAEREEKSRVMEACLKDACSVPLEIMRACAKAVTLCGEYSEKGSVLALSDAGVGAAFCKAALQGASLNVFINTAAMSDRGFAAKVNAEAEALLAENTQKADRIFEAVKRKFASQHIS